MHPPSKVCGAAIFIALGSCLFSPLAQADILACRGAGGAVTYTNGECAETTRVKVLIFGARPVSLDSEPVYVRHTPRGTTWTRPIKLKSHRPDVASIHAAKLKLQRMDAERRLQHGGGGTQLAEYRE
jgi:hypothetical protein